MREKDSVVSFEELSVWEKNSAPDSEYLVSDSEDSLSDWKDLISDWEDLVSDGESETARGIRERVARSAQPRNCGPGGLGG